MSVIDKALQELQGGRTEPPVLSVHDAMAAILIASVSVDGALGVDESSRIQHVMSTSRLFKTASGTQGAGSVERAVTLLQEARHGFGARCLRRGAATRAARPSLCHRRRPGPL